MSGELMVVAGEASGDAMALPVIERLGRPCFGLGGPALVARGLQVIAPRAPLGVMGLGAVAGELPRLLGAFAALVRAADQRRPRAALLVGFSEFNARLGPRLRRRRIRVLWYGPPQIWAWRPGRGRRLARAADRLAVILPFEQALWRGHGAAAHYVGHPALERSPASRAELRARLGLPEGEPAIALLPGSRAAEVTRHLEPMLAAARLLRAGPGAMHARVLIAEALPDPVLRRIEREAESTGIATVRGGAAGLLPAFDVAATASGTATLECALAGVPPLIVHRTDPLTFTVARRLVRAGSIGLPNVLLGERRFPELLQSDVSAERLAGELRRLLGREDARAACSRVRAELEASLESARHPPSERVAELIEPWFG